MIARDGTRGTGGQGMTADRSRDYLVGLVRELCNLPHETEWVEFKVNHRNPQAIGEYVSALSNSAFTKSRSTTSASYSWRSTG